MPVVMRNAVISFGISCLLEPPGFTIQWIARGEKELNTSYFRAANVYSALDKLYYGRDINTITVFSVVLNPAS